MTDRALHPTINAVTTRRSDHRTSAGALVLDGAVLAAGVGPRGPLGGFWRPAAEIPQPGGPVLAGLIGENLLECLAFGAGLAVLATAWLLASWFPYGALHLHLTDGPPPVRHPSDRGEL